MCTYRITSNNSISNSIGHVVRVCIHLASTHLENFKGFCCLRNGGGTQELNGNIKYTHTYIERTGDGTAASSGCRVNIYTGHRSPDKSKRSSNTKRVHLGLGLLPALRVHEGNIYFPSPPSPHQGGQSLPPCRTIFQQLPRYIYIHTYIYTPPVMNVPLQSPIVIHKDPRVNQTVERILLLFYFFRARLAIIPHLPFPYSSPLFHTDNFLPFLAAERT